MPRAVEIAMRAAVGQRGVAVIVISGDTALKEAVEAPAPRIDSLFPGPSLVRPGDGELERLANLLNASSRVTLLCGSGCAGAHEALLALGAKLKSPMVHALRGKEHGVGARGA
jgi:pyruvate dehydrogenase (quinone)